MNPSLLIEEAKLSELKKNRPRILIALKKKWQEESDSTFNSSLNENGNESTISEKIRSQLNSKQSEFEQILTNMKGSSKSNFTFISPEEFKVIKRDLSSVIHHDLSSVKEKFAKVKKGKKTKSYILNGIWIVCFVLSFLLPDQEDTFFYIRTVLWGIIGLASAFTNGIFSDKKDIKSLMKLLKLVAD